MSSLALPPHRPRSARSGQSVTSASGIATIARPPCKALTDAIARHKEAEAKEFARCYASCGIDPMHFLLALRRAVACDALTFTDVTVLRRRTYWYRVLAWRGALASPPSNVVVAKTK